MINQTEKPLDVEPIQFKKRSLIKKPDPEPELPPKKNNFNSITIYSREKTDSRPFSAVANNNKIYKN